MSTSTKLASIDHAQEFLRDVLDGLSKIPKSLPCKYFYDQRGSTLFDNICELDEYYLTRVESQIMKTSIEQIVEVTGSRTVLVEFGSGSSSKTRLLLKHLAPGSWYVPVDISGEYLLRTSERLSDQFPHLRIRPVIEDFTQMTSLPDEIPDDCPKTIYFPGSTIGNFCPESATSLLDGMRRLSHPVGSALIGVDLIKSTDYLIPAYNDASGITAAFNLNLLERINRELGCRIPVENFNHRAKFNAARSRVEMHLVANSEFEFEVANQRVAFKAGESIHTENSYKYSMEGFCRIAGDAGWQVGRTWTDEKSLFSIQHLICKTSGIRV